MSTTHASPCVKIFDSTTAELAESAESASAESAMTTLSAVKKALLEKLHREIVPQLEQIVLSLPEHLLDFSEAETHLRTELLGVARSILDIWSHSAKLDVSRPCCPQCKMPMRHRGVLPAKVCTTVGEVGFRRPGWRCGDCQVECYPHDESLKFQHHGVSWPLAKICTRMASQIASFEEAAQTLEEDYHVHLAKETLRTVAEEAGTVVLKQEETQQERIVQRIEPLPQSEKTPELACVFADGTTVHTEGSWHEIRVVTVATQDKAGNPIERQSRARFMEVDEVAWTLLILARGVGYQNATKRAFIADGATWLWRMQEKYFATATPILDWYHLTEHVHKASNAIFGLGSGEAKTWSAHYETHLWEGRVEDCLTELQREMEEAKTDEDRESLRELVTYITNNQDHVNYPRYRELGLPIGSGQVEAQCKSLVGRRCKQAGMRNWTYEGAEAVLRMRAAYKDGNFHELWDQKLRIAA